MNAFDATTKSRGSVMKDERELSLVLLTLVVGCGGEVHGDGSETGATNLLPDSAVTASSTAMESGVTDRGGVLANRVPLNHRPVAVPCPQQRGEDPMPYCVPAGDGGCAGNTCNSDSYCTMGTNGRCGRWFLPGIATCSYDQCFSDSDCPGGLPCECRTSVTDDAPNICANGGNCSVDSDCGPGGYCSPQPVRNVLRLPHGGGHLRQ